MPRAIATARDALSNHRRESATRFERLAKQALVLATKPRARKTCVSDELKEEHSPIACS